MTVNIGLGADAIKSSINSLNNLLSDHFALLVKTWNYHWNVKGVSFHSYHAFMEELYDNLIKDIDEIAERIRALDGRPIGSLKGYLSHIRIKEHAEEKELPDALAMLAILSEDTDSMIRELRSDIKNLESSANADAGTLNFLEDMIERKEKTAWMIRAYLEK